MNEKQLTFPQVTKAVRILPNGEEQDAVFGQYEAIIIVKENGLDIGRSVPLTVPTYPVTIVECKDGSKFRFLEPFYKISDR